MAQTRKANGGDAALTDRQRGAQATVTGTVSEIEEVITTLDDPEDLDALEEAEATGQDRDGVYKAIERRRSELESGGGADQSGAEGGDVVSPEDQQGVVTPGEPVGDVNAGVNPTQNTQLLTTTDDLEREVRVGRLTPEQAGRPDLRIGEPASREHEFLSTEIAGTRSAVDRPQTDTNVPETALGEDDDSYTQMGVAFRWAMRQLMHPAEQGRTCPQHGRVPMTHMCSSYQDSNYASAIKLLKELGEETETA